MKWKYCERCQTREFLTMVGITVTDYMADHHKPWLYCLSPEAMVSLKFIWSIFYK